MKSAFAIISLILGLAIYVPYLIRIWHRTAKPHVFSWTTWGILCGLGFFLSASGGGGEGAWLFALESVMCFGLAGYALFRGEKHITRSDRIAFASALVVTVIYIFTKQAVLSVVLAAVIDCLGFFPTFRKSYRKPQDEPALSYFLSFLAFLLSLFALEKYSFVTMFYPLVLMSGNISLVLFLLARRRRLRSV